MYTLDCERFLIACPQCRNDIRATFGDVHSKHQITCPDCHHVILIGTEYAAKLKSEISEVDRASRRLARASARVRKMIVEAVSSAMKRERETGARPPKTP